MGLRADTFFTVNRQRIRRLRRATVLAAVATMIFAPANSPATPTLRWGADGHRIIAEVALARLSPAVADETRRLLGGQSITEVGSWADAIRSQFPNTGPWHFTNIQLTDSSYIPSRDCKENACVVGAVETQLATLSDRTRADTARASALKYVVHFIGDLHQPLHAGERGDRGGNDVKVTFSGRATNLHSLWDSGLLGSFGQSTVEVVRQLNDEIGRRTDIAAVSGGTVVSWVMESHDVSRDVVYRNLPRLLEITPQYVDAARPIIHDRLLRGGVRLAAVLERALGGAR